MHTSGCTPQLYQHTVLCSASFMNDTQFLPKVSSICLPRAANKQRWWLSHTTNQQGSL